MPYVGRVMGEMHHGMDSQKQETTTRENKASMERRTRRLDLSGVRQRGVAPLSRGGRPLLISEIV